MRLKTTIGVCALLILPLGFSAAKSYEVIQSRAAERTEEQLSERKKARKSNQKQNIVRLVRRLDLTPEQSQQIEAIKVESSTSAKELAKQLNTQQQQVHSLLVSNAGVEQIREKQEKSQNILQQLSSENLEAMLEIRAILTDGQKAKMVELVKSRSERRANRQSKLNTQN